MPKCVLNLKRSIRVAQTCGARVRRSILCLPGYQVYYREVEATSWTLAGFIPETDDPLQIALPTLADGEYEIKVVLQGCHWDGMEDIKRGRFKLSGGVLLATLPQIYNLGYGYGTKTTVTWLHKRQHGVDAPGEFALWTSVSTPVDTSGVPEATVPADGYRRYAISITQVTALYVAVAARFVLQKGPVTEIYVPLPAALPDEPTGQFAEDEDE